MVELHIEQGNFIEKSDKQIGIVEGIMIFVLSINGRSLYPEEKTKKNSVKIGVNF